MTTNRQLLAAAILLSAALAAGCSSAGPTEPTTAPVNSVSVTLPEASITAGHIVQATAALADAHGNPLTGRAVAWSSSNTAIAVVSATGEIVTVAAGIVDVAATSEGKSGHATLTIEEPILSVVVTVPFAVLAIGQTVQATAITLDARGDTLTGRPVGWGTSNPATVKVSSSGLISAIAIGGAKITAVTEDASGVIGVTVNETGTPTGSVKTGGRHSPNQLPNR